jgi:amino acid transporter
MTGGPEGIRKRSFRLLKNVLILCFALILFSTVRPELASFVNLEIGGFEITSVMILDVSSLFFIIYFGYFILIDLKYFLDFIDKFMSIRLGARDRGKAKNITYDAAAIISLILAAALLTPLITSVPDVGETIGKGINIVFIGIGFFIVYHLANEIHYLVKIYVEKIGDETSRQTKTKHKEKTSEGEKN